MLTEIEAYSAMINFLEGYYQRGKSDDIAILLGSMSLLKDGHPADAAMWSDWIKSIEKLHK